MTGNTGTIIFKNAGKPNTDVGFSIEAADGERLYAKAILPGYAITYQIDGELRGVRRLFGLDTRWVTINVMIYLK